ncbi:MAG: T9SS type A sorting domain-containing protein [Bacteroidetes bacterium]|nr:MAG: T9SS type A sorting domain-containing protein [Bacteroidota bacterium]
MKYIRTISLSFFTLFLFFSHLHGQTNFWQSSNGPWVSIIYSLWSTADGNIYAGGDSGIYRSTDKGGSWTLLRRQVELPSIVGVVVNPSGHIFGASVGHCVMRSTDSGGTWDDCAQGITRFTFHCLTVDTSGYIYVGCDTGVFRSVNNGMNWTEVSSGLPNYAVTALAVDANNKLFAATAGGGVYLSSDNGNNWSQTGWLAMYAYSLAISPNGTVFAGLKNGGAYRTTDYGQTWERIAYGISKTVYAMAVNSDGHVYAGTDGSAVYRSIDNGTNWEWIYSGMQWSQKIRSMVVDKDDYVYAGTNGNGVFRSLQATTPVDEQEFKIPTAFALAQNYPNPFNPATVIQYSVPSNQYVSLKIYNMLGEEVATLVDGMQDAGYKKQTWDASGLPSGIYYYQLHAGEFVETRKLLLVR